ncbi:MAG: hypothetical protein N3A69_18185 [Leptospiraceae bacterium]|nr:hypothetical protein [Leptospiraceae bacterium]
MKITQVPHNYVLLDRVLGLLTGLVAVIDPYRTIYDYAEEPIQEIIGKTKKEVSEILRAEGNEILTSTLEFPIHFQKALVSLNRGRLKISLPDLQNHTDKIYVVGQQIVYSLFTIAGVGYGNYFLGKSFYVSLGFYLFSAGFFYLLVRSWNKNRISKF